MIAHLIRALALATVLIAGFATSSPVRAELLPTPVIGDSRLVEFEFDDDNVYLVLTRPKRSTFIRMGSDEQITYVSAGDPKNFEASVAQNYQFMEVKPKFENAETNLTIVTTKRTYQLILKSTFDGGKWYQRVTWKYPQVALLDLTKQAQRADAEAASANASATGVPSARPSLPPAANDPTFDVEALQRLDSNYKITGDASFRPVSVVELDNVTMITFPSGLQELPALFRFETDDPSKVALVDYEVAGSKYVVRRRMDKFLLKLGKAEVTVERAAANSKWFRRRAGGSGD